MRDGMGAVRTAPASPVRRQFSLILMLGLLAAAILWFAVGKAHYLTDFSVASYSGYYWPRRWGLILHLAGGGAAISTGLAQLWLGFTGRTRALHRALGRIYVGAVIMGIVGGGYLGFTIPGHLAYRSGLLSLDLAWIATTTMAVIAIRDRNISQHRDWMIRSYVVTFAFVNFRLLSLWLSPIVAVPADPVATDLDTMIAWTCWAVPLLVAEIVIQWRAMRSRPRSGGR